MSSNKQLELALTFEGIEQGCVDLLELHWEHVMIDSGEWALIAGYEN